MSSYDPPIEDIPEFNSSLFNQPEVNLTQAQADLLYLSKTKNDTSTAALTTFTNQLRVDGNISTRNIFSTFNAGAHELWGAITGTCTIGGTAQLTVRGSVVLLPNRCQIGIPANFNLYPTLGTNNTVIGNTTASTSLQATSASNVIIGSGNIGSALTTGSNNVMLGLSSELGSANQNAITIGNGVNGRGNSGVYIGASVTSFSTGSRNVLVGANTQTQNNPSDGVAVGYAANFYGNNAVAIGNTASVVSTSTNNIAIGTSSTIIAGTGASNIAIGNGATINANISNSVAIGVGAIASVNNTIVLGRTTETIIIPNRIQFTPATYSFPFASDQQLGYYLKTTGTALASSSYTSGTYVNLLTTASIPVGVWRIDYSATNTISGGGNITATDTLVSATSASSTQVPFTGSRVRTHTTENYSSGDSHIVNGSFTYQQSTAAVLYLVFSRTFSSGTYSWVGELAITRIA